MAKNQFISMNPPFAVVDIETSGGSVNNSKIIEIAIVITDGYEIQKKYETLINPKSSIPPFISELTGIYPNMVKDSPTFHDVAQEIHEYLIDCSFVAHNVGFDYGFVQKELKDAGIQFKRPKFCTVKMARKTLGKLKSYNLDSLTDYYGIIIENRHRAMGDAYATARVFNNMYKKMIEVNGLQLSLF